MPLLRKFAAAGIMVLAGVPALAQELAATWKAFRSAESALELAAT